MRDRSVRCPSVQERPLSPTHPRGSFEDGASRGSSPTLGALQGTSAESSARQVLHRADRPPKRPRPPAVRGVVTPKGRNRRDRSVKAKDSNLRQPNYPFGALPAELALCRPPRVNPFHGMRGYLPPARSGRRGPRTAGNGGRPKSKKPSEESSPEGFFQRER